ncbi:MAG: YitT family protein [Pseudomonadota bacterium]
MIPEWEEISHEIIEKIRRGVTITRGRGGYTGREVQILYAVVNFRELSRLKQVIRRVDPDAFVVVTDTLEVMGHGIGNQTHWKCRWAVCLRGMVPSTVVER